MSSVQILLGWRSLMKLIEIASKLGARVLTRGDSEDAEVKRVWAGDKMSDLLNAASNDLLLVTNLNNQQLIRAAELMDIPAICLLNGLAPDGEFVKSVGKIGTVLMVSPHGMYETCGLLYQFLNE